MTAVRRCIFLVTVAVSTLLALSAQAGVAAADPATAPIATVHLPTGSMTWSRGLGRCGR